MKIGHMQFNLNNLIKFLIGCNLVMFLVVGAMLGVGNKDSNAEASKKHTNSAAIMNIVKSNDVIGKTDTSMFKSAVKLTTAKVDKKSKTAFLTFDDGPSINTDKILAILRKYHVKATFFVNGHTDKNSKKMYKLILKDGNVIGNHTYSHEYKYVYKSIPNFKKDIIKLNDYVEKLTGKEPIKVLRFPGGSNNRVSIRYGGKHIMKNLVKQVKKMGYSYVDWNVDSEDASAVMISKKRIVNNVLSECKWKKTAVILMHDSAPKKTTVAGLAQIISSLKKKGFRFDTIDHMNTKIQFLK
ncbi:polysaccharide deacetylase family protein [Clostridium oryzae]|uniref:Peptidoglycan-N-acetylmuramic acid deacetylase PdaA n=1 Tax=Clostridium oryzae TaxID=1450648 RepID=A0A1V4I5W5_9CLOT|nr:polysaccharide deacetylase family protein [Clostridium oryzae]OPJ55362.1 peptidoglycan-N-acetylmuramic acid deacetylase PdaA precursor [Clostridium oryzae]